MHLLTERGAALPEGRGWRKQTLRELEEAADELLRESGEKWIYTERALARKMRLEKARLPETRETAMPAVAASYLLRRQMELLTRSARLTRLQSAVLNLALQGWGPLEIASQFRLSPRRVRRLLRIARRRVAGAGSPYDGLYEVYWSEVNRYVYRKGR